MADEVNDVFQGVHLRMCGKVLRCLGRDTCIHIQTSSKCLLNGVTTYNIIHTRLTCCLILFVFCGMTRKFTLFVSGCNCHKFCSYQRRKIILMHVAPWGMRWMMYFKGCISWCAVKSSGVWEATLAFTSRLPPRGLLNGVTTYNFSTHVRHAVVGLREFLMHRVKLQLFMLFAICTRLCFVGKGSMIYYHVVL